MPVIPIRPAQRERPLEVSALRNAGVYALAVLLPVIAIALSLVLPVHDATAAVLLGLFAVVISALVGGRCAGYVASGMATAALIYIEISHGSAAVPRESLLAAMFAGVSLVVSYIIGRMLKQNRQLFERGQRIRLAQRAARIWFWEWDLNGDRVSWSGLAADNGNAMSGTASFDAYLQKTVFAEDRERVRRAMQNAVHQGSYENEHRVIARDGSIRWISARGKVFYEDSQPTMMLGMASDITSRKSAEEAELRSRAVLWSLVEGVCYTDPNGKIIYINPAAERLLGITPEQARGRDLHELVHCSSDAEKASFHSDCKEGCCVRRALHDRKPLHEEEDTFQRQDGHTFTVEFTAAPVHDEGRVIGAVLLFRDISERKRVETALRNSEKLAATGRIAATISHELNNPLESVTNLLYIIASSPNLNEQERAYLKTADQELVRMGQIIRQTLGMHRQADKPVPVEPAKLIDGVLLLLQKKLVEKNITVEKRFESHEEVPGFPAELRQVFSNLIVNATEAMQRGGKLRIVVHPGRDWSTGRRGVRIVVIDNGSGIKRSARQHLFEPFFTTKGEKGTGLGLWVSNGIVAKHRGKMRVHSNTAPSASYTAFSIFLPAADRQQRVNEPRAA